MQKKLSIALCTIISCYSTLTFTNQTNLPNAIAIKTCENRLAAIAEEDKNAYFHTNIAWGATGLAGIATFVGVIQRDPSLALGGGVGTAIAAALAYVSKNSESDKTKGRSEEREKLLKDLRELSKSQQ